MTNIKVIATTGLPKIPFRNGKMIAAEFLQEGAVFKPISIEKKTPLSIAIGSPDDSAVQFSNSLGHEVVSKAALPAPDGTVCGDITDEEAKEFIVHLAALTDIAYERARVQAGRDIGITASRLDKLVKEERLQARNEAGACEPENDGMFPVVEPCDCPVDLADLLDEIAIFIRRHVVTSVYACHALSLWVAMSYVYGCFDTIPIAMITAPDKRCGKTQVLRILLLLCWRGLAASNITAASIFRTVDRWRPTLLIDEADTFLKGNESIRGILNSGHTKDTAFVIRVVTEGGVQRPVRFSTFAPKAIAGIGDQADTLTDRSIVIEIKRKLPHEIVEGISVADKGCAKDISRKLVRFSIDAENDLRNAEMVSLEGLNDRAQDNWKGLVAIADRAGGHWPASAKRAAYELSGRLQDTPGIGATLLRDIQVVFAQMGCEKVSTADLLTALCSDEEGPWSCYHNGQKMTPRCLAVRLALFGIKSNTLRFGSGPKDTAKGFKLDQFKDVFARYVGDDPSAVPRRHSVTVRMAERNRKVGAPAGAPPKPQREV